MAIKRDISLYKATIHFTLGLLLFSFMGCNDQNTNEKVIIAAAANMRYPMKELIKAFEQETNIQCDLVTGSSGTLTAQINEGAPYDIFVSADSKYPNQVFERGLAKKSPKTYAYGKLVLWTMKKNMSPSISLLKSDSIQHIALANPKTAPYGSAAISVLDHYSLLEEVGNKLVYGESISQTNQFIMSTSAEIGFTAMSTVLAAELKDKGAWIELENHLYEPIEQDVVILNSEKSKVESVERFYDFLFGGKAQKILKNFGYSIDE